MCLFTVLPQVVAIASRDITRSKEFASKFDIAVAYGSYEDLAKATDIGWYKNCLVLYEKLSILWVSNTAIIIS